MNLLTFPPTLIKRAIDDLAAIGDAARRLPLIERMATSIGALDKRLEGIQSDVAPIGELAEKVPGVG